MNKLLPVIIVLLCLAGYSCDEEIRSPVPSTESSSEKTPERTYTITVYANDGEVIKEYKNIKYGEIDFKDGGLYFIEKGKQRVVYGIVTGEED